MNLLMDTNIFFSLAYSYFEAGASKVLTLTLVFLLLIRHSMQAYSAPISYVGSEMFK